MNAVGWTTTSTIESHTQLSRNDDAVEQRWEKKKIMNKATKVTVVAGLMRNQKKQLSDSLSKAGRVSELREELIGGR